MCLNAGAMGRIDAESETLIPTIGGVFDVAHSLTAGGFDASEDGTGRWTPLVFDTTQITSAANRSNPKAGDPSHPLAAGAHAPAIAFGWQNSAAQSASASEHHSPTLDKSKTPAVSSGMRVRRLTPRECERLQGFPDDYTLIPWRTWQESARKGASYEGLLAERGMTLRGPSREECPDAPRYRALGNSWAVPVVRWIGQRIALVDSIAMEKAA